MKLLLDIDPDAQVISRLTDVYVKRYPTVSLEFDKAYVDRYTGIEISNDRVLETLRALGFGAGFDGSLFHVEVPSWRATKDVTIKADIIEEIKMCIRDRAKNAPAMPASTSPLPPLAMPGFPVGFTAQRPSGAAMTVAAPFSTTTAPVSRAFCWAAPSRSDWISGMESSHSRAISPGWRCV